LTPCQSVHLYLHFYSDIKQKNEGGWTFRWDEESKPGYVLLEVEVSRFLDSSLIDVDIHPTYVSAVIKSKVGTTTCAGFVVVLIQ
jgi:hypothetical protein